jgi:hypothetical protein
MANKDANALHTYDILYLDHFIWGVWASIFTNVRRQITIVNRPYWEQETKSEVYLNIKQTINNVFFRTDAYLEKPIILFSEMVFLLLPANDLNI